MNTLRTRRQPYENAPRSDDWSRSGPTYSLEAKRAPGWLPVVRLAVLIAVAVTLRWVFTLIVEVLK